MILIFCIDRRGYHSIRQHRHSLYGPVRLQLTTHADISQKIYASPGRLTSILISRFLLDLQAVDQKLIGVASTGSRVESAVFQCVVGSLGGEVRFGDVEDYLFERYDIEEGDDSVEDTENDPTPALECNQGSGIEEIRM